MTYPQADIHIMTYPQADIRIMTYLQRGIRIMAYPQRDICIMTYLQKVFASEMKNLDLHNILFAFIEGWHLGQWLRVY